ncbi:uncharacterized protein RSE6_10561 [Rhynchosporium secalis]|uniref:Uncharacterized protein n=1 Tax=Rhynchosporium secalis TaxID=38038 RepID=A0A1E1MKR7_RHYSE|nr:uncharacterized protein RSE6_10561 [Rhynchosporium secalis]
MDAWQREDSHSRRPNIKRPWEAGYVQSAQFNARNGSRLPSIGASSYRRPSLPSRVTEADDIWGIHNESESRNGEAKRARYEDSDHHSFSREVVNLKSAAFPPVNDNGPDTNYTPDRSSLKPLSSRLQPDPLRVVRRLGDADNVSLDKACHSCNGLIMQGFLGNEDSGSAEVLKYSAGLLNKTVLVLARIIPETGGVARNGANDDLSLTNNCPPEEGGLKPRLHWLLNRIQHVNDLAERLMQNVPTWIPPDIDRNFTSNGSNAQDGLEGTMKRRIDADLGDTQRPRDAPEDTDTDAKLHTRRRSVATTLSRTEDLLLMRNSLERHSLHPTLHSEPTQRNLMNPPPPPAAPNRQLLSPPGRSLPSPKSLNFYPPSSSSYGSSSQNPIHLLPSGPHYAPLDNYLPPIAPVHSSDALQVHASALQHEISVQKIDLSSLQDEHNNLLAALKRSQTRAIALEKKHRVSDTEIISLTEEKLRLQSQVVELERDVEDLARSRDEFRQAAVEEGAQYVEIVKRASRLEKVAGEEKKGWNRMKIEMEQKIEALGRGKNWTDIMSSASHHPDNIHFPASSTHVQNELKMEPSNDPIPSSHTNTIQQDSNLELEEEVRRLRNRCAEVESALRAVQEESRSMEGIVEALGLAGKSILERADRTLAGS